MDTDACPHRRSISLQREDFCLDAVFGDELDLHAVAGVDVPFGGDDEDVLHEAHHLVLNHLHYEIQYYGRPEFPWKIQFLSIKS